MGDDQPNTIEAGRPFTLEIGTPPIGSWSEVWMRATIDAELAFLVTNHGGLVLLNEQAAPQHQGRIDIITITFEGTPVADRVRIELDPEATRRLPPGELICETLVRTGRGSVMELDRRLLVVDPCGKQQGNHDGCLHWLSEPGPTHQNHSRARGLAAHV